MTINHRHGITGADIESRATYPVRPQLEQIAASACIGGGDPAEKFITRLLASFNVEDRGVPIAFEHVKVGDKIRAVRATFRGVTNTNTGTVGKTHGGTLFSDGSPTAVLAEATDALYLLERVSPARLTDMSPGVVKDGQGRTFMWDGAYVYRDAKVAVMDHEPGRRPWSQVSTLTPVEPAP